MKQNRQIASFQTLESRSMLSASPAAAHHLGEEHPADVTRPVAATALAANVEGSKITLSWTDNATNETGYQIFRMSSKGLSLVGTMAANAHTFVDNAAPAGNDTYAVRAFNKAGNSEGSPYVSVHVEEVVNVVAPRKTTTTAISVSSIKLTWEGDFGATAGYKVERRSADHGDWAAVGSTRAGVRVFIDTGLTAGTKYQYRITAISVTGRTATAGVVTGMTKASDKAEPAHKTEPIPKVPPQHSTEPSHK